MKTKVMMMQVDDKQLSELGLVIRQPGTEGRLCTSADRPWGGWDSILGLRTRSVN